MTHNPPHKLHTLIERGGDLKMVRTRKLYNRQRSRYSMLKAKKKMLCMLGTYLTGLFKGMMIGMIIGKKLRKD